MWIEFCNAMCTNFVITVALLGFFFLSIQNTLSVLLFPSYRAPMPFLMGIHSSFMDVRTEEQYVCMCTQMHKDNITCMQLHTHTHTHIACMLTGGTQDANGRCGNP